MTLAALLFGTAAAVLAVFGAQGTLHGHVWWSFSLGAIVALGMSGPGISTMVRERSRVETLEIQQTLQYFAAAIREDVIEAGVGLTLRDVGVHVYITRRRRWLFWRREHVRYARSSTASRSPNPKHSRYTEAVRRAPAPGLPGIAARQYGHYQVDLMDEQHLEATEPVWNDWFQNDDPRGLGSSWDDSADARKHFSAIWAEPIPAAGGATVGTVTINVEREVGNGHDLLIKAGAGGIMRERTRSMGHALPREMQP